MRRSIDDWKRMAPDIDRLLRQGETTTTVAEAVGVHPRHLVRMLPRIGIKHRFRYSPGAKGKTYSDPTRCREALHIASLRRSKAAAHKWKRIQARWDALRAEGHPWRRTAGYLGIPEATARHAIKRGHLRDNL